MEDDNLILLLNTNKSETTTPIQQKREPLVEITDNDNEHDSIVTMNCLNDCIPVMPSSNTKHYFDDIKLVRSSPPSQSSKQEKIIDYALHLTSRGNRNSTDNLIQSSIDVTLSSNSSRDEQQKRPQPTDDDLAIVTIVGAEDNGDRENENPIDTDFDDPLATPTNLPKTSIPSQVRSTPDVQISRFDKDLTTSNAAFARSQLVKRFLINQGQQRSIPIQSLSNTTNNDAISTSEQQQSAASLAATVAASVAVSVAQPFLKLQNEFEQKMNNVLDQIHHHQHHQQQHKSNTDSVIIPVATTQQPIDSHKQVNDCVDTRMKFMEKIQEQQQQELQQLLDLVRTRESKSKSPVCEHKTSKFKSESPHEQRHFLDTLIGTSSPPVRLTKSHKKHHKHKNSTTSPSAAKRPSRVTGVKTHTVKIRPVVTFERQPPNSHFNIESSSPYACSVCDRSRSRSRSRSQSPTKGLSPDSSYPRPFVPVPRPPSIMSDGFIPSSTSTVTGNALKETYPPFDKYLNNSVPPSPLQPKSIQPTNEYSDLHERIKQIDEKKKLLDENYLTLQRRHNDPTLLKPIPSDTVRVYRLVEQCVKQVTRQVREEVKARLEQDEIQHEEKKPIVNARKRPTSTTQLAFDRHLTTHMKKQTSPTDESSASRKPYSDAFMEAVYGRSLYQKIKKDGKQPYFKLKQQRVQPAKQAKQIEQLPVKDTGLKHPPTTIVPPRCNVEQPPPALPPCPALAPPVYEPEYYHHPNSVTLLGPPQIRDTRSFQPISMPSAPKLAPHILPSIDFDPSTTKVRFGQKTESIKIDIDENEEHEEDDGQGIEIPGYHETKDDHQQVYDGPRFPPTIPHDEGYRNRQYDTLQSGAIDWLEQELIARFMNQLQNQQATIPIRQHRDVISAHSSTSSSSDDRSIHDRLLDLLGQDGFQLFIDMGQPIDQDLIQALTREVLEERISQMLGFQSPRESIRVISPPPVPHPRTTTPTTTAVLPDRNHLWPQDHSVPTPTPTPPHSPPPPPVRDPRVMTPEITGEEISSESEPTTPRPIRLPEEDFDRPLPSTLDVSVRTPERSESPSIPEISPASSPRQPPTIVEKRDASTMASVELPSPPPPVIIQPSQPPSPPPAPSPPPPSKPKTPSPVLSTLSSSSSSSSISTSTSFSTSCSSHDSPISDHMWLEDRSQGEVPLSSVNQPQGALIIRRAQRLLSTERQDIISPPDSPAGGTHTLSVGEIPHEFPNPSRLQNGDNGHTTPPGSDESNNSGKSEGEVSSNAMANRQSTSINIRYRRSTQGFLGKKNNRK